MDMSDLFSAVVGFLLGYGLKIVVDQRKTDKSHTSVNQSGSAVGGSQVGRDMRQDPKDK